MRLATPTQARQQRNAAGTRDTGCYAVSYDESIKGFKTFDAALAFAQSTGYAPGKWSLSSDFQNGPQ